MLGKAVILIFSLLLFVTETIHLRLQSTNTCKATVSCSKMKKTMHCSRKKDKQPSIPGHCDDAANCINCPVISFYDTHPVYSSSLTCIIIGKKYLSENNYPLFSYHSKVWRPPDNMYPLIN